MISAIIVGIGGWEEYTVPLVAGIWGFEPDTEILVIDNASENPYPQKGSHILRLDNRVSYAEAINIGVKNTSGDWILILNNDIKCHGKFKHLIEPLQPDSIYGRQIITQDNHVWLGIWLALMTRDTFNKVGEFDPKFEMCGFEDADYCVRAKALGIDTLPVDLPFEHLWGKTRWGLPKYPEIRLQNMDYFEEKHGYRLGENVMVIHD